MSEYKPPSEKFIKTALFYGLYVRTDAQENAELYSAAESRTSRLKRSLFLQSCWGHLRKQSVKPGLSGEISRRIMASGRRCVAKMQEKEKTAVPKPPLRYRIKETLRKSRVLRWLWAWVRLPVNARNNGNKLEDLKNEKAAQASTLEAIHASLSALREEMLSLATAHHSVSNRMREIQEHAQLISVLNEKVDQNAQLLSAIREKTDTNAELAVLLSQKSDDYQVATMAEMAKNRTVINGNEVICVQYQDGILLGVPANDWRIAMYLSRGGLFEYGTEHLFNLLVKEGMIIADIGANLGIYSIHALRKGCTVHAFEPVPYVYTIMKENIGLNGFELSPQVHTYNYAVSDSEGFIDFSVTEIACGQSSTMFPKEGNGRLISVPCTTIDEMLKDVPRVDLVKIDVEGAEPHVLLGMKETIRRNPHIQIIMEVAPTHIARSDMSVDDLFGIIENYDMEMMRIHPVSGELEPTTPEQLRNVFSENIYMRKQHKGSAIS